MNFNLLTPFGERSLPQPSLDYRASTRPAHLFVSTISPYQTTTSFLSPPLPLPPPTMANTVPSATSSYAPSSTSVPSSSTNLHFTPSTDDKPHLPADRNATIVAAKLAASAIDPGRAHGRNRFPCTFPNCSLSFERRYNLKVHLRKHTNEKPYKCKEPGCNSAFKWRSSAKHHVSYHQRLQRKKRANAQSLVAPKVHVIKQEARPVQHTKIINAKIGSLSDPAPRGSPKSDISQKEELFKFESKIFPPFPAGSTSSVEADSTQVDGLFVARKDLLQEFDHDPCFGISFPCFTEFDQLFFSDSI